jgi:hypothetical protein
MSQPIGGYFELEHLSLGHSIHNQAYPVNFGRAGLELIVRHRKYKRVFLPDYICPEIFSKLMQIGIVFDIYPINETLEPSDVMEVEDDEAFLYVNYFGIKDSVCKSLEKKQENLILDLSQAFFYHPQITTDAFNSARKFVGVPDGGYVFGDWVEGIDLETSSSWTYCEPILRRLDGDLTGGYKIFKSVESDMAKWSPQHMSQLTTKLLAGIKFERVLERRNANFFQLHSVLGLTNRLTIDTQTVNGPLCYPYMVKNGSAMRKMLIENKVFVPTYWPNLGDCPNVEGNALNFVDNLVCLPCDQRYGREDMSRILEVING